MSREYLLSVLPFPCKNDLEMFSFESAGKRAQHKIIEVLETEIMSLINKKLFVEKEVSDVKREAEAACSTFELSVNENAVLLNRTKTIHVSKMEQFAQNVKSLKIRYDNVLTLNNNAKYVFENELARRYYLRSEYLDVKTHLERANSELSEIGFPLLW